MKFYNVLAITIFNSSHQKILKVDLINLSSIVLVITMYTYNFSDEFDLIIIVLNKQFFTGYWFFYDGSGFHVFQMI